MLSAALSYPRALNRLDINAMRLTVNTAIQLCKSFKIIITTKIQPCKQHYTQYRPALKNNTQNWDLALYHPVMLIQPKVPLLPPCPTRVLPNQKKKKV